MVGRASRAECSSTLNLQNKAPDRCKGERLALQCRLQQHRVCFDQHMRHSEFFDRSAARTPIGHARTSAWNASSRYWQRPANPGPAPTTLPLSSLITEPYPSHTIARNRLVCRVRIYFVWCCSLIVCVHCFWCLQRSLRCSNPMSVLFISVVSLSLSRSGRSPCRRVHGHGGIHPGNSTFYLYLNLKQSTPTVFKLVLVCHLSF